MSFELKEHMQILRKASLFITAIILLAACSGDESVEYDYTAEDELLKSTYREYESKGIDLKAAIKQQRDVYIKHGILQDTTAESFVHLLQRIKENDLFPIEKLAEIQTDLAKLEHVQTTLLGGTTDHPVDPSLVENSRAAKMMSIFDSVAVAGSISGEQIASWALEISTLRDFQHPYFKALEITILNGIFLQFDGIGFIAYEDPETINRLTVPHEDPEEHNILHLLLDSTGKISLGGHIVSIDSVKSMVNRFVLSEADQEEINHPDFGSYQESKAVIMIHVGASSYELYVGVNNEVDAMYHQLRNDLSEKKFGMSFDDLYYQGNKPSNPDKVAKEKAKWIKKAIPKRIIEGEPR